MFFSDKSVYDRILADYDQTRQANERSLQDRKQAIYQSIPEIYTIDQELIRMPRLAFSFLSEGKSLSLDAQKSLEAKISTLLSKKRLLLLANGYSEDYLQLTYKCPVCKDTGYVTEDRCECFKQKLLYEAYAQSNMIDLINTQNFETFDESYFSTKKSGPQGRSSYETMKRNVEVSKRFVDEFTTTKRHLLLYGGVGLGKTFLSSCIAKALIEKGHSVLYLSAPDFFRPFEDHDFNKDNSKDITKILDFIVKCDMLIIDDLGTELNNSYRTSKLFEVVQNRILHQKSMIISTNLSPTQLSEVYTDRLSSRIVGYFDVMNFIGDDIRIQQKIRNGHA